MALTDLTRISTSGIATGTSLSGAILHGDAHFRGTQVGVTSALFDSSDNALEFNDDVKLKLGNDGDFEIYHRGADNVSIINETGSAYLSISSNGDKIEMYDGANGRSMAEFATGGACLFKHGTTTRFETTSTGAKVTGILTATEFSGPMSNGSGISTFYDLRVSNNLTVEGTTTTLDTNVTGVDRLEVNANSNTNTAIVGIQSGTADIVNLFDGSTEVLTVTDGGSVGLGTQNPQTTLHLKQSIDNNTDGFRISRVNNAASYSQYIDTSSRFNIGYANPSTADPDPQITLTGQTGNVGIGSAIPIAKLDVFGQTELDNLNVTGILTARQSVHISDSLRHLGDLTTRIRFPAANTFTVETAGSEKLRITSDGDVGIGTDNPATKLHISGAGAGTNGIRIDTSGSAISIHNHSEFIGFIGNDSGKFFINAGGTTDTLSLRTNGASRIQITNSGVGIGSDTPTERLVVQGDVNSFLAYDKDGGGFDGTSGGALVLGAVFDYSGARLGLYADNAGQGRLMTKTGQALHLGTDNTRRVSINSIGYVGINTINALARFDLRGASGTNPTMAIHHSNADVEGEVIRIGRTDINTIRYHSIKAMHGGAATNNYISFNLHNGSTTTSQSEVLRLRGDGRVGIGSDAPHRSLVVKTGSGDIHGLNGNAGIYFGTDNSGGFIKNCAIARSGATNYHIAGSTAGDLCIGGEAAKSMIFGLSHSAGAMDQALAISRLREFNFYYGSQNFKISTGNQSSPVERLKITSGGNILCGGTAVSQTNRQLVVGSDAEANFAIETHNTSASETANIRFYRSRGTAASPTTLVDGDILSQQLFYAHDGTDYAHTAAIIRVKCNGTVASNNVPGEIQFHTNPGSTSANLAMTITKEKHVLFSGLDTYRDTRNVTGITVKSTGGVSFQNYGSNGSRNWRIRPDDMSRWGDLDFSVSPTSNSSTDWPDAAADKVLTLGYDKDVIVPNGNLVIGTSGKGIDFSATADGHGTPSELLDDYEEGSFTATLGGSGWTYSNQHGFYRKVGTIVHVSIWIQASGGPNNSASLLINLPFTSYGSSVYRGGISASFNSADFDNGFTEGRNRSHIDANVSYMQASFPFNDNGNWSSTGLTNAGVYDGFSVQASGTYISNT